jgi:maltooligosyltrehalose trehalohydrolase
MHEFRIWGPLAKRIQLRYGQQTCAMNGPDEMGWWTLGVSDANSGMDYAFLLDDDPTPYPDPRSLWQPEGVHGPSRLYDNRSFPWTDARWQPSPLFGAVLYELHIGTFSEAGTFDGAIAHLDHLVELGITHVEVMPVADFAGDRGWGYDGVALFAVANSYGGPDGFKRFVDACHAKGLAVILDVVYNHFGPVGNYTNKFGPYLTDSYNTLWGAAVNFSDAGSDEVRRFFCDNAEMWLRDYHVDGLRLDAVHAIVDRSAVHFLEQLSAEVERLGTTLGRKLVLIAESDLNDPRLVRPREANGYGIDAQWSDDLHHALFTLIYVTPEKRAETEIGYYADFGSMDDLVKALREVFVYDGRYSVFRKHRHGRPVRYLAAQHFVVFAQNHDQIGNRARGERLEHLAGLDAAKVALGLVLMAPFVPMLFMGEEFAASSPFLYFANHEDPEMMRLVTEGRKREFAAFGFGGEEIPDPEALSSFQASKLKWSEVHEGQHAEMLAWTKDLIHLRRSTLALNDGDLGHLNVEFDRDRRWLVMQRGSVRVLINLGSETSEFSVGTGEQLRLCSRALSVQDNRVQLPAMTLAILTSGATDRVP